jgi:hypothetical protein
VGSAARASRVPVDWLVMLCHPSVGSLTACRARPAPAAMWLNRGGCRPEVRLPVADHRPRDERPSVITIGIDPHKRSVTAVALDAHRQPLGSLRVAMINRAVV